MMRGPRALRTRVTALAVLAAAVAVALLVAAFNLVLAASLDGDVDRVLRTKAAAATTTAFVTDGHVVIRDAPNDEAIDREVWVYERGRALVRPAAGAALQGQADALSRRDGAFADSADEGVRLHSVALTNDGSRVGAIVVATSLAAYDRTTDVALAGSVALGGLLLALVAVLTWISTGRALAPVREMTHTAAEWSAHDHGRRFGPGPRPDELGELAETFDALLDRLAASLRHEQRLSAELSHELRTPLARIAAGAELLARRGQTADELVEGLRAISSNASEMEAILDTLMKAARADAGLGLGRAALEDVFDRIASTWTAPLAAHDIALDVGPANGVDIGVDVEVAERILAPLLQNAQRHAVARVALSAERAGTAVLVHLDDDGAGIPEAMRGSVFEPGQTGAGSDGAGLGLALARRLARATGGEVEVVSSPDGTGTRLRVRLPA